MIRKAHPNDAKEISKLIAQNYFKNKPDKNNGFIQYKRSPKKVKRIINKSLIAFVYIKNNQIIGFMNAYPAKKKKKKMNWLDKKVKNLYFNQKKTAIAFLGVISPKYNHQGIGSQLFNELINQLNKKGYKYFFASVSIKPKTNKASLKFVKKFNFHQVAETTTKSGSKRAVFIRKL